MLVQVHLLRAVDGYHGDGVRLVVHVHNKSRQARRLVKLVMLPGEEQYRELPRILPFPVHLLRPSASPYTILGRTRHDRR